MLEQLLILLFVFVLFLLSTLVERFKARQRQAPQHGETLAPPVPARAPTPLPPRVLASRAMPEEPHSEPAPSLASPQRPTPRLQAYIGNQQDVRRGIILMTLLGPCRALEPPSSLPRGATSRA